MVVVFETSDLRPVLIAEHDDPRVRPMMELMKYHCFIKERGTLEAVTAWDIKEVADKVSMSTGPVIEMDGGAIRVDPLLKSHVGRAMTALSLLAAIVEERHAAQ